MVGSPQKPCGCWCEKTVVRAMETVLENYDFGVRKPQARAEEYFQKPCRCWCKKTVGECNGGSVTGSRHSRYTESNIYSSCTRVELCCLYMLVTCSKGCTSHQLLILYMVAINIYNITRSNRGTGDPLQQGCGEGFSKTMEVPVQGYRRRGGGE